jgi:hypothetical protein
MLNDFSKKEKAPSPMGMLLARGDFKITDEKTWYFFFGTDDIRLKE